MANPHSATKLVTGIPELTAVLRELPADMRALTLSRGVAGACKPVEIAAKRYAKRSERTGALRESITTKVVNYKKDGRAVGLVGPDRAYFRGGKKVGKLGALLGAERPANYAHLIEHGHVMVAPRKGTSIRKGTARVLKDATGDTKFVAARPFIRPALLTTQGEQAAGFYAGIEKGYTSTLNRVRKSA